MRLIQLQNFFKTVNQNVFWFLHHCFLQAYSVMQHFCAIFDFSLVLRIIFFGGLSPKNTSILIRGLSWSMSSNFGATHYKNMRRRRKSQKPLKARFLDLKIVQCQ